MTSAQKNAIDMVNLARESSSAEFRNSVPELATDGSNIGAVGKAINEFQPNRNEFLSNLWNRIGLTFIMSTDFTDEFAFLEKERLTRGDTVQDIFTEPKPGYDYEAIPADGGTVDPFVISRPIVFTDHNSTIIKRQWLNTLSDEHLRMAFIDVNKLDEFMRKAIDSAFVSLQAEKWGRTKSMFGSSGIYKSDDSHNQLISISGTSGDEQYKAALLALKNARSRMKFLSRKYNGANVLTRTPNDRICLAITSEFYNAIGVNVLSGVFNLSQAETQFSRITEVDSFSFKELGLDLPTNPQPGLVAVVYDELWVKNHDMIDSLFEAIRNPRGLYWNYYLNWWALRYYSPFGNIIGITTEPLPTPGA